MQRTVQLLLGWLVFKAPCSTKLDDTEPTLYYIAHSGTVSNSMVKCMSSWRLLAATYTLHCSPFLFWGRILIRKLGWLNYQIHKASSRA